MVEFGLPTSYYKSPNTTQLFVRSPEQRNARTQLVEKIRSGGLVGLDVDYTVNVEMFLGFMFDLDECIEQRDTQLTDVATQQHDSVVTSEQIAATALGQVLDELQIMNDALPRPSLDYLVAPGAV